MVGNKSVKIAADYGGWRSGRSMQKAWWLNHRPPQQNPCRNHRANADQLTQPCKLWRNMDMHNGTGSKKDREQIVHKTTAEVEGDPMNRFSADSCGDENAGQTVALGQHLRLI